MPWMPTDTMSLRSEFVQLAQQEGRCFRTLCQRFGISPKTGYKWCARYQADQPLSLSDQSRRPLHSPTRTAAAMQQLLLQLRQQHPTWGGRKLQRRLLDLGHTEVPAPSTITGILRRHGLITPQASEQAQPWLRFEHAQPNALWQIDFKGYFETVAQRCHPLTLLDDHSRFNLTLSACARTDSGTVQGYLQQVFARYGLPARINADNGAPWGSPREASHGISILSIWLIRLGITVSHSRPGHPQTNGKEERFHRTLKADLLNGRTFRNLAQTQQAFDAWRTVYNEQRPHQALGMATPISHYQASPIALPARLPPIEYGPDDHVVDVGWNGWIRFQGRDIKVSNALHRLPIALRPDPLLDGVFDLYFCHQCFDRIDLNQIEPSH